MTEKKASLLNPLVLAYVGDAVHSLFVRERLVNVSDHKAGALHKLASDKVNAHAQACLADKLFSLLTEEEKEIFLRGRNGKNHHVAKNQTLHDYKNATGIEAVFGYLYLTGQNERLAQLVETEFESYEN